MQHDEEDADREREQTWADELVEPADGAHVAPGGDVVGQPAGGDEEQAEDEEDHSEMEHANGGDDLIVGGSCFPAAALEAPGGAVGGGDAGFGGLEGVAALPGALLLGAALALAADGERGVQAHRVHPASTARVRVGPAGAGAGAEGTDPCPCRAAE